MYLTFDYDGNSLKFVYRSFYHAKSYSIMHFRLRVPWSKCFNAKEINGAVNLRLIEVKAKSMSNISSTLCAPIFGYRLLQYEARD